jgi:hypothetical protein
MQCSFCEKYVSLVYTELHMLNFPLADTATAHSGRQTDYHQFSFDVQANMKVVTCLLLNSLSCTTNSIQRGYGVF